MTAATKTTKTTATKTKTKWTRFGGFRTATAVAVVALIAAGFAGVHFLGSATSVRITAEFTRTDGVFAGNAVTILGVPTGRVESVIEAGPVVRVELSLPRETRVPADAHAWVVSPSVVSDRAVELGPGYVDGPSLEDGAVIPVERTHSPLTWDQLTDSINDLVVALGPETSGGGTELVSLAAHAVDGNGERFRDAVQQISGATALVAGESENLTELVTALSGLVGTLSANRDVVGSVTESLTSTARQFAAQRAGISESLTALTDVLGQVSALISAHGDTLTHDIAELGALTGAIAEKREQLAEIVDVSPTGFENVANLVTDEGRARIRLNVSTNLAQFPATKELCDELPIPLCQGPGLVNPLEFPPNLEGTDLRWLFEGGR